MPDTTQHKPVLEMGEKLLIITRRMFAGDARRHFIGTVERYDAGAIRVRGHAYVYDAEKGGFIKRKSPRTRLFPLDNHLIVFLLPYEADLTNVRYEASEESGLVVTDGKNFKLEVGEFSA